MKRNIDDAFFEPIKKRTYEEISEADFSLFITPPVIPFDINIGNGSFSFQSHRAVAMKISSFFKTLLEGDQTITEINLDDITDTSLALLERFIYSPQENRLVPDGFTAEKLNDLESLFALAAKYDVKMIRTSLLNWVTEDLRHFKSAVDLEIFSKYQRTNCAEIFRIMKKHTAAFFPSLHEYFKTHRKRSGSIS